MKKIIFSCYFSVLLFIQLSCVGSDHKLKNENALIDNTDVIAPTYKRPVTKLPDRKDTLLYEINLDNLPIKILEEFTNENQKMILNLKNGRRRNVSIHITSNTDLDNIRINNILFDNKSIDGPFGKQIEYIIDRDYSIVIGKNFMASENQKGKFSVTLK
ncbi:MULTISPECIES: hypothetical protein [Elizabethkingia]|uniref:Uncharacterized protein n=1 Tax=Elizabethkingia ursingii TaxID=1756150 RepID=A0AAJ3NF85_9FLAO|nr:MULTISPECIES: hypothetical protein [Elizabethkingia]AQW92902.1 hypothetical protein BBD30_01175 [Elizabethkingia anophelis]AQX09808.1 hypothetical protein BBD34_14695 [Elizabethkingia ursingii]OPB60821.1 hypothetical protein BAS07_17560 [Elizabethkingia anophelis]OPB78939.1 hypothetical protein BAY32_18960 [Elizabethkingia ursingii]OPB91629.1 hypothetical protein BB021_17100 [Elizabethkingia ursingii]